MPRWASPCSSPTPPARFSTIISVEWAARCFGWWWPVRLVASRKRLPRRKARLLDPAHRLKLRCAANSLRFEGCGSPDFAAGVGCMPLRIAWVGGGVGKDGGVGGISFLFLDGLLALGSEVEFFAIGEDANALKLVRHSQNLSVVSIPISWQWNRWYSRNRLTT